MHISFDISQTGKNKAGCGYFSHAMISAMLELAPHHRYSLFPSFGDFYFDPEMPARNSYCGTDVHYGPLCRSRTECSEVWNGSDVEDRIGTPAIVHSNNYWCPVGLSSSRLIYTLYDLAFAVNPNWTTETNRVGCFEGVFRSSIVADWVVAISEATRDHYLRTFPHFPEDRIRVIYPCSRFGDENGTGRRPTTLPELSEQGYWLSVGTIEPRKNQRLLAKAYANYLAAGGLALPLVFVGGNGWLMDDLAQYFADHQIDKCVVMTGYVSDEELIWLYRNCYANLYPALFEGFGLPVLEGMQYGAPTLASSSTSLPEVAGSAAVLLDPEDAEAWTMWMLHIASDKGERERLSVAARERARQFDWRRSAGKLLDLYQEAVDRPKRAPG